MLFKILVAVSVGLVAFTYIGMTYDAISNKPELRRTVASMWLLLALIVAAYKLIWGW